MSTRLKRCTKCLESKSLDEFHYIYTRKHYIPRCKSCEKERKHCLYIKNKAAVQKKNKEYREKKSDEIKELKRRYYIENKKAIDLKNKERCKERNKKKCKETIAMKQRKYYEKNREKIRERERQKYKENKHEYLEKQRERRRKNTKSKLSSNLRTRVKEEIGSGKDYLKLLGCRKEKYTKWLEFNFKLDGDVFNWKNYGKVWHIDHVRPCRIYDLSIEKNRYICFNWKNTMPVFASYNLKKGGKIVKDDILKIRERVKLFKEALSNGDIKC